MRAINLSRWIQSSAAILALAAQISRADSIPSDSKTNALVIQAELRQETGLGQSLAERAYITFGKEKFALLVPSGFRGHISEANRMTLVTANFDRLFALRVVEPLASEDQPLRPEGLRQRVLEAHPGARILAELSRVADGRVGPAFDVEWIEGGKVPRRARVAFIPSHDSLLEFSMVCSPEVFDTGCQALNTIFTTFRASDGKGELHISPLSDKL